MNRYLYILMEKDNNMLLDILVFLLIISYCSGMYVVYYIVILCSYWINACYFVCIYVWWVGWWTCRLAVARQEQQRKREQSCLTIWGSRVSMIFAGFLLFNVYLFICAMLYPFPDLCFFFLLAIAIVCP